MSQKHPYLSKAQCTLFNFYTAKELEDLVRSAPQLGFTARKASNGQVRFYARDHAGRKRQLPKAVAEESYLISRMDLAEELLEEGRLNSAGITVELIPGTERVRYSQNRRDGRGRQQIDGQRAQDALKAYRRFQACMKEGNAGEAVQLAREYLPKDCLRVAERVLARKEAAERGTTIEYETTRKKYVQHYEALLQQGTLDSVEKAAALARKHLTRKEAEEAERKLYQIYNGVSLDEFAAWETGIEDYSAQSPLEEELRIEFGGNGKGYNESAEDDEESPVRRNTGAAFGKGLAGVEV